MKWRKQNQQESIRPLEQQQAEKLRELGFYLQQVRLEQDMSLEEVAAKTRIRLGQIDAIEKAQIEELPEPIYIRSLIKQYADALGLDGVELSNTFPTSSSLRHFSSTWMSQSAAQLRPIHLYLIYIFVIVCAVSGLSNVLSRSELEVNNSQQQQMIQPAARPGKLIKRVVSGTTNIFAQDATETNKQVRIGITLQAQSWVRVVVDGKTQFEGVLPEGYRRTWVAQQVTVRASNAGGVMLSFNQEKARKMGNIGQVQELTFAANSKT